MAVKKWSRPSLLSSTGRYRHVSAGFALSESKATSEERERHESSVLSDYMCRQCSNVQLPMSMGKTKTPDLDGEPSAVNDSIMSITTIRAIIPNE